MDFRRIATAAALLSLPFGLGFVLLPTASGAAYGLTAADAATQLLQRYFGSEVLMYAAAAWGLRSLVDPAAQRTAARCLGLATASGLTVTLHGTVGATLNGLGWSSVPLYGFFVLAWGRLAFASVPNQGVQINPGRTRTGH
jgi:hypothetical protein